MVNKKGQEMSVATLLLIVLGLVIVVLVILGFSMGWSGLLEKINIFKPSSNIDDLMNNCNLALTQPGAFCEFKAVTLNGTSQYVNCQDSRIAGSLGGSAPSSCNENTPKMFCGSLTAGNRNVSKTVVNGQLCSVWAVASA